MKDNIRVGLISLGCAKNLADSENMLYLIKQSGYIIENDASHADVIIINTCAFLESAQQEAVNTILEMAEYKNSGSCRALIVTGCLPQLMEDEISDELPEVDAFLGTGSYDKIVEAIQNVVSGQKYTSFADNNEKVSFADDRVLTNEGHFAYLKIADGCDNLCSYCLIPKIRGIFRSKPVEELIKEAGSLAKKGVKELIVIAQDTTKYGVDLYNKYFIGELLQKLAEVDGIEWIRIQYCYPERVHGDLLKIIANEPKVLHYFDIPIQHVNQNIIKKMARFGNIYRLRILFENIRRFMPDAVLRTSVIVGFPGEGEKEFLELLEFIKEIEFDHLGVFTFSPMEGTDAANMANQVPEEIKVKRQKILMEQQEKISQKKLKNRIGTTMKVIVDGFDFEQNLYYGRSYADSPEVDGVIYFGALKEINVGDFVDVTIKDTDFHDMYGQS